MIAKCINGNCGSEFEEKNPETFFDVIDDDDFLFEIEKDTFGVIGYVFCPVCGSKCIKIAASGQ